MTNFSDFPYRLRSNRMDVMQVWQPDITGVTYNQCVCCIFTSFWFLILTVTIWLCRAALVFNITMSVMKQIMDILFRTLLNSPGHEFYRSLVSFLKDYLHDTNTWLWHMLWTQYTITTTIPLFTYKLNYSFSSKESLPSTPKYTLRCSYTCFLIEYCCS